MSYSLRPYQERQHDKALACWGFAPWWDGDRPTARTIILKQPTAGGKTITASKIIETLVSLGVKCLFCADTDELVQQPLDKLQLSTGIIASLEKAKDRASLDAEVVVASVQSMSRPNRLERFPVDHFGAIFHDEAHEGPDRAAIVNARFPNAMICGLTATPFRISLKDLKQWYEVVADELDLEELIDGGYIPPVRIITDPLDIDLSALKMSSTKDGRDVNLEDSDRRIIPWFEAIVERVMTKAPNAVSVAFHGLVATSQKFRDVCVGNGLQAKHVDGDSEDREAVQEWFRHSTGPRLLTNSQLLRKGWDCDVADTLIPLRITKSVATVRQQAGRILRPLCGILDGLETAQERIAAIAASAKPVATIFDFLGLCEEMGLAGPASILGADEEESKEMARILKKRPLADLQEIRHRVQEEREEKVRKELERKMKLAAKSKVPLIDAMQLALDLHDRDLINYEPVMPQEMGPATGPQKQLLATMGINPDQMEKGRATKILDALLSRQRAGRAPYEAFQALKAAGFEHPEAMSLDDSIRALGDMMPMTFGKKYRGEPLRAVPKSFWHWLMYNNEPATRNSRRACQTLHPAVWRYLTRVIFPAPKKTENQPELAL